MPPIQVPLGVPATVADVLRTVRDDERPFALTGSWAGSRAIVGSQPRRVVSGPAALDVLDNSGGGTGDGVYGGWFGFLGYGLGATIERLPPPPPRPVALPLAELGFYDHVLRQDAAGDWWFEALEENSSPRLEAIRARLGGEPRPFELGDLTTAHAGRHLAAVADCVERIAAGELFQANLCLRLEGEFTGSAADAYLAAADTLRPAHGAFLGRPDGAILSFSPELFLRRAGDTVTTSPIKGTATGETPEALEGSAKDAAEHVMIVDLSRNDLGRVAAYGTVHAGPRRAEPHPGLWHLVTDVTARVPPGTTDAAVVRAAFPPGSVTGAPKVQALKVIATLEGTQREAYTGAIGFASPHAGLELSVAIRTLELQERGQAPFLQPRARKVPDPVLAWMGCGGGIVTDSDPRAELDEALAKARPIAAALGARVAATGERRGTAAPWPRRPDPGEGLLETLAIRDGELVDAAAHLDRLTASAKAVYGLELRRPRIEPEIEDGRVRVLVTPAGDVTVQQRAEVPAHDPVALEPRALAGGLGRHKWLDRPGEPHWLVCDLDGTVLESATANLWILKDGELLTPPADGRILPGTTRARLLESARATRESELTLDDLETAEAIVLTSSIRLVTPAGLATNPTRRSVELARELRDDPVISRKTGSYIRLKPLKRVAGP